MHRLFLQLEDVNIIKDQGTLGECSKDDFITVKFCDCSIRLS